MRIRGGVRFVSDANEGCQILSVRSEVLPQSGRFHDSRDHLDVDLVDQSATAETRIGRITTVVEAIDVILTLEAVRENVDLIFWTRPCAPPRIVHAQ